jgi:hypothetical protein
MKIILETCHIYVFIDVILIRTSDFIACKLNLPNSSICLFYFFCQKKFQGYMDLMLFYCLYAMPPVVEYIYINKDWSRNQTVNTLNVEKLPSTKYNRIFFFKHF